MLMHAGKHEQIILENSQFQILYHRELILGMQKAGSMQSYVNIYQVTEVNK